jgi:hypothetical protein
MIGDTHRQNLASLTHAFKSGRVALYEVKNRVTGKNVVALCAVNVIQPAIITEYAKPEYEFIPFAVMLDNPYEDLEPLNAPAAESES